MVIVTIYNKAQHFIIIVVVIIQLLKDIILQAHSFFSLYNLEELKESTFLCKQRTNMAVNMNKQANNMKIYIFKIVFHRNCILV